MNNACGLQGTLQMACLSFAIIALWFEWVGCISSHWIFSPRSTVAMVGLVHRPPPAASMLPQLMVQKLCSPEEATLYNSRFYSRFMQHGTGIKRDPWSKLTAEGEAIEKRGSLDEQKMHQTESLYKEKMTHFSLPLAPDSLTLQTMEREKGFPKISMYSFRSFLLLLLFYFYLFIYFFLQFFWTLLLP